MCKCSGRRRLLIKTFFTILLSPLIGKIEDHRQVANCDKGIDGHVNPQSISASEPGYGVCHSSENFYVTSHQTPKRNVSNKKVKAKRKLKGSKNHRKKMKKKSRYKLKKKRT